MTTNLQKTLNAIDWPSFDTAYGPATKIPLYLQALWATDATNRLDAAHDLWCSLCHQRAYVSSAAWPALPFLVCAFDHAAAHEDHALTAELLDIFLGFAQCTTHRRGVTRPNWMTELRGGVRAERARFEALRASTTQDVADLAHAILEALDMP
ncbi:hypothetical protein [Deinococcus yavapaiensis]|uniref:Uncharacterized protein n=1 Tax=Deinococcus yavapaiensis KR-236 TaxID=694435 RepID=A0A318S2N7_9DEIO|nr:hypothetical protein [Deinococcus yavapaiensis]PYE50006.1 hypothetical protein DES52_11926 [Deinococcus yavapaiensis KR-236]